MGMDTRRVPRAVMLTMLPPVMALFERVGNERANAIWCKRRPDANADPVASNCATREEALAAISNKYVARAFVDAASADPVAMEAAAAALDCAEVLARLAAVLVDQLLHPRLHLLLRRVGSRAATCATIPIAVAITVGIVKKEEARNLRGLGFFLCSRRRGAAAAVRRGTHDETHQRCGRIRGNRHALRGLR